MLCTHGHVDHVGGLSGPLSVMKVDNIYAPHTEGSSKAYNSFKTKAAANGLTIQHPKTGDQITVGSALVEFYAPTYTYTDNLNDAVNEVTDSYIGNARSRKFHRTSCRSLPAEHNRVYFISRSDAINAGYAGCGLCKP